MSVSIDGVYDEAPADEPGPFDDMTEADIRAADPFGPWPEPYDRDGDR